MIRLPRLSYVTRCALPLGCALALSSAAMGQGDSWDYAVKGKESEPRPWRLADALGTPDWFWIGGWVETRFESLDERLRSDEDGSNQGIFMRTLVEMTLRDEFLEVTGELMDSRIFDEPDDARTTTGQVNSVEMLQGYAAGRFTDAFLPGDKLRVQLGRHTMNVGSRRFAARNRYRNTINAFTGLNAQWESQNGVKARAFYTLPVQRLPGNGERPLLRDNEIEFDRERTQVRFYGLHVDIPDVIASTSTELYYFGINENDAENLATANRDLNTFGTRWNRKPKNGQFHWEWESAYQFGQSRASRSSDRELDHSAYLHHLTLGYQFEGDLRTRAELLFDYASGDNDPRDGVNSRFDTLFGVPRPEYGPTGIFRAVSRANIVSPGIRISLKPAPNWDLMLLHRFNYLASDRDAWTTTGIQDPTGGSGSHIGNLSEMRVRYDWIPKSVRFELGVAYHAAGSFSENAPNSSGGSDALFGYFQTNLRF